MEYEVPQVVIIDFDDESVLAVVPSVG